jgi:hypothetical protein
MDKSINKTELNKTQGGRVREKGELLLERELDKLAEELVGVAEEIDRVTTETSTLEDIEGCKVVAAAVLENYSNLHKRLSESNRTVLEQSVGPAVERVKKGLTLLKEAPE